MARLLVTGATGYIGGQLVARLLRQGHSVGIIVRPRSDLSGLQPIVDRLNVCVYDGGIASLDAAISRCEPEIVCHLASLFLGKHAHEDVDRLVHSNILFPSQLLEAMDRAGVRRIVNTGTSWQNYQDAPYDPVNLYAATKQAFEAMLTYYVAARDFRAVTLRLFDTYGPGDRRPKLFTLLRRTARQGTPLKMSPGGQLIDLVYIEDVLDAFVAATEHLPEAGTHRQYGVSCGAPLRLRDLAAQYAEVVGRPLNIAWGGLPYRPREVMVPWRNAPILPGWSARTALRDGIVQMERDKRIDGLLAS